MKDLFKPLIRFKGAHEHQNQEFTRFSQKIKIPLLHGMHKLVEIYSMGKGIKYETCLKPQ